MSFDKRYPRRKDRRQEYYGSKRFDKSCRNHGGCPRCQGDRLHSRKKNFTIAEEKENEYWTDDQGL